jgi:hypothetical protein
MGGEAVESIREMRAENREYARNRRASGSVAI